jgi:DNA adenine methylase|tara:strand:- start:803 stop:1708 length:906 start_codon:yes stop_codon:yes gene_type:complete
MKNNYNRSPLFYMGDKYKLLPELVSYFPPNINRFVEPFTGGGSVFLNVKAKTYLLNDIDKHIIEVHKLLKKYSKKPKDFFKETERIIIKYNLSRSYKENVVPKKLKEKWPKTYYAHYNKQFYLKLRDNFNKEEPKDYLKAYILLIYGFNRIMRFNSLGKFNLPVGNVDFNKNVFAALEKYFNVIPKKKVIFSTKDYFKFLNNISYEKDDFIYADPPYLITFGEYNKFWNSDEELKLLRLLDNLNKKKVKWALSNVIEYKKKKNELLNSWMKKYYHKKIKSNYISFNDNSIKNFKEVLVINY